MPLYLVDVEKEIGSGPFEDKAALVEAFDEDSDDDPFVIEIDSNGGIKVHGYASDFLESAEE